MTDFSAHEYTSRIEVPDVKEQHFQPKHERAPSVPRMLLEKDDYAPHISPNRDTSEPGLKRPSISRQDAINSVVRFYNAVRDRRDGRATWENMLSSQFTVNPTVTRGMDRNEFISTVWDDILPSLPDLSFNVHQVEWKGDGWVQYFTQVTGTHTGAPYKFRNLEAIEPTGQKVELTPEQCDLQFDADGKICKIVVWEKQGGGPVGLFGALGGFGFLGHFLPGDKCVIM